MMVNDNHHPLAECIGVVVCIRRLLPDSRIGSEIWGNLDEFRDLLRALDEEVLASPGFHA
jgi:hypothetical protein